MPFAALPSSDSALGVVEGRKGALVDAAVHTAGRALIIGAGLKVVGDEDAALHGIAGALAIEAFALLWFWGQRPVGGK